MAKSESKVGTLITGLAMGFVVGMLIAPRSGKETRARWRRHGKQAIDDIEESIHQMARY